VYNIDLTPRRRVAFRFPEGNNAGVGSLGYLAAVNVVVWGGLFAYLWRLDRRLSEKEREP
jgi:CcmD family protein